MSRPQKRSVTLSGHRTSITLEADFWDALKEISTARDASISTLIQEIDNTRLSSEGQQESGLSSAIRTYILKYYKEG